MFLIFDQRSGAQLPNADQNTQQTSTGQPSARGHLLAQKGFFIRTVRLVLIYFTKNYHFHESMT